MSKTPSKNIMGQRRNTTRASEKQNPLLQREIILQMEVLISQGKVDYVIIHKGDNIDEIVDKFAKLHNLTSTKQGKLLRLVQ